jgi:hypothetical protein
METVANCLARCFGSAQPPFILIRFLLIEILPIMIACCLTLHRHVLGFFSIIFLHPQQLVVSTILELIVSIVDERLRSFGIVLLSPVSLLKDLVLVQLLSPFDFLVNPITVSLCKRGVSSDLFCPVVQLHGFTNLLL